MTTKEAIKQEARECKKSANDFRNTPERRDVFYVFSIVLDGIADKLEDQPLAKLREVAEAAEDYLQNGDCPNPIEYHDCNKEECDHCNLKLKLRALRARKTTQ